MDVKTHPNRIPNPYHRKIELQSPLDLAYLQSNIARSAREKLDLHFPPSASQPAPATHIPLDGPPFSSQSQNQPNQDPPAATEAVDPMRARVQSLVEAFLTQTWEGAKQSISINGIDADALPTHSTTTTDKAHTSASGPVENIDFTYAPYDDGLQKRLAVLHTELESLTTQVSKLRRDAPGRAAKVYGERLGEVVEGEGRLFEERQIQQAGRNGHDGEWEGGLELDAVAEGWAEELSKTYERGLRELWRLGGMGGSGSGKRGGKDGSLTETVGKAQRARTVAMELE